MKVNHFETGVLCEVPNCGSRNAIIYKQNTAYYENKLNYACLCPNCKVENDHYWEDCWIEYRNSQGV